LNTTTLVYLAMLALPAQFPYGGSCNGGQGGLYAAAPPYAYQPQFFDRDEIQLGIQRYRGPQGYSYGYGGGYYANGNGGGYGVPYSNGNVPYSNGNVPYSNGNGGGYYGSPSPYYGSPSPYYSPTLPLAPPGVIGQPNSYAAPAYVEVPCPSCPGGRALVRLR